MSTADSELLARAIATQISAEPALGIEAQYSLMPDVALKDLRDAIDCRVRDVDEQSTPASRIDWQSEYFIEVQLRKKVGNNLAAVAAEVKYAAQQIRRYYARVRGVTGRAERFARIDRFTLQDDQAIQDRRVIKGTMTLVFRGYWQGENA